MVSKPIIMEELHLKNNEFVANLHFSNNISLLGGAAATGKTCLFHLIQECESQNPQVFCIDENDYERNIFREIKKLEGKMIVIDNADILLSEEVRNHISLDGRNQYLIIGRNLFATKENLFELTSIREESGIRFEMIPFI